MEHSGDVITVLTTDHREVEGLFAELEMLRGSGQDDRRKELTEKVITELVRHSVAEEAYLYPAARKRLPGGDALADREVSEHAEAERLMKDLEGADPADPVFDHLLDRLIATVRQHVREEEHSLFPELVRYVEAEELVSIGRKILAIKKIGPTRPHPAAPDSPPANKLLAPGTGLVDRVRDLLSGRGRA
ncbi:hemerythrin domain-containing protein [Sphaerisporangium album]|uniref:Hemerythrin domain-containing protein n=1 Tax=Sphaerisporangium album TaxID=509200 RepID=A0A367EXC8_9ACTN|nr:hemerythrin domain-containing protein [Sphaerisporangium album]RCG22806.1 hemerythrin domain-containing protein [Sphaerisporangium album]